MYPVRLQYHVRVAHSLHSHHRHTLRTRFIAFVGSFCTCLSPLLLTTSGLYPSGYGDVELHISASPLYMLMLNTPFSDPNVTVSKSQNPVVVTEFHSVHVVPNVRSGFSSKLPSSLESTQVVQASVHSN